MDLKTAFLNGDLDEEMYMEQPKGFMVPGNNVRYKLIKSLYGLKQAPKQRYKKFDSAITTYSFKANEGDTCVYSRHVYDDCAII